MQNKKGNIAMIAIIIIAVAITASALTWVIAKKTQAPAPVEQTPTQPVPIQPAPTTPDNLFWKSEVQGDLVNDDRDPDSVCKKIQSAQKLDNCNIIIAKKSVDRAECVDGMSVAGCFACKFECPAAQSSVTNQQTNNTITEINAHPTSYLEKTVQIEAIVKRNDDGCYLEEGDATIKVNCWAPDSVAQCDRGVEKCFPPVIMGDYLNKKVKLSGTLKELEKEEYINEKWVKSGVEYIVSDVTNPAIVN